MTGPRQINSIYKCKELRISFTRNDVSYENVLIDQPFLCNQLKFLKSLSKITWNGTCILEVRLCCTICCISPARRTILGLRHDGGKIEDWNGFILLIRTEQTTCFAPYLLSNNNYFTQVTLDSLMNNLHVMRSPCYRLYKTLYFFEAVETSKSINKKVS